MDSTIKNCSMFFCEDPIKFFPYQPKWERLLLDRAKDFLGLDLDAKELFALGDMKDAHRGIGSITSENYTVEWMLMENDQIFRTDGRVEGVANNGTNGIPAIVTYFSTGGFHSIRYVNMGRSCNPNPRTPAVTYFHQNGKPSQIEWWDDAIPQDSKYGHPAQITYTEDGVLCEAESRGLLHGRVPRKIAIAEEMVAAANKRMAEELTCSDTLVMARSQLPTIIGSRGFDGRAR